VIGSPARRALVLAALLAVLGCGAEPDEEAPTPTPRAATTTWHTLGAWAGRGDRQTESFDITSGALRVVWKTSGADAAGAGIFRVTLHSAISGRPLETVVDAEGNGTDTVRFAASPRVAHLLIESSRLDWTVELQEGVSTPGS
jgi:hypothetical protein